MSIYRFTWLIRAAFAALSTVLLKAVAPSRTFGEEARKRERVRCSSLVDWPVYPRLKGTMQGSVWARNSAAHVAARLVSFGCRRTGPPPASQPDASQPDRLVQAGG